MKNINLPHQEPLRFAQEILSSDTTTALVRVCFQALPTLPMLVESAAQSSAAFGQSDAKQGFLVMMKDINLHRSIQEKEYVIQVVLENELGNMRYFNFKAKNKETSVCTGSFVISLAN